MCLYSFDFFIHSIFYNSRLLYFCMWLGWWYCSAGEKCVSFDVAYYRISRHILFRREGKFKVVMRDTIWLKYEPPIKTRAVKIIFPTSSPIFIVLNDSSEIIYHNDWKILIRENIPIIESIIINATDSAFFIHQSFFAVVGWIYSRLTRY